MVDIYRVIAEHMVETYGTITGITFDEYYGMMAAVHNLNNGLTYTTIDIGQGENYVVAVVAADGASVLHYFEMDVYNGRHDTTDIFFNDYHLRACLNGEPPVLFKNGESVCQSWGALERLIEMAVADEVATAAS
jgi:hypothetical protein